MLIYQGWFTALYSQRLLYSQSFEFLICILQAINMPQILCTNVFVQGDYPVILLPHPRRLAPSLGLGTTWVRQLRSGSCHHPTAATKCKRTAEPSHRKPRRWKRMLIHQGWFTALYTLHLLDSQSFEFRNLHITSTQYAANTLHHRIFPREAKFKNSTPKHKTVRTTT